MNMQIRKIKWSVLCFFLITLSLVAAQTHAAPPIFNPIGEERALNSNLYVVGGNTITFTISAQDPDGDPLTYAVESLPAGANFNPATKTFTWTTLPWATTIDKAGMDSRLAQQGIFDVVFKVNDGTYTVQKIVTINVLDAGWTAQTMAELMASRPITAGVVGTPVSLTIDANEIFWSSYGGGKNIRRITFQFTSQIPNVSGWNMEEDWITNSNCAYLPINAPAANNAGAVVEGAYSDDWGNTQMAERACAELDLPVVIIDLDWQGGGGKDVPDPHVYTDMAGVYFRDPRYCWEPFSSAHFLRAGDALVNVINIVEPTWLFSYAGFRMIATGHSKFGNNCWTTAAADPQRVTGFMSSGWEIQDYDAYRLLSKQQGGNTMTAGSISYVGLIMKYFSEPLGNQNEMNPLTQALFSGTTNDMRGIDPVYGYMAKYAITVSEKQFTLSHRVGYVPNLPHTPKSPQHSTLWRMWLAHCFLGRPLTQIDTLRHYPEAGNIIVEASISGSPLIQQVNLWASNQSDADDGAWDNFVNYPMTLTGSKYQVQIPSSSTVYYVEVLDQANGVDGIVCSSPRPVNKDYLLLREAPRAVENLQTLVDQLNSRIRLTWSNPLDADFAGIIIRYDTSGYPATALDGTKIYDGMGATCDHNGVSQGNYYYAAFTYDSQGNYSQGVTRSASVPNAGTLTPTSAPSLTLTSIPSATSTLVMIDWQGKLVKAYPNPAKDQVQFLVKHDRAVQVKIIIANAAGEQVALVEESLPAGQNTVVWQCHAVAPGIYMARILLDNKEIRKIKVAVVR